jgi:hypothetical protein
MESSGLFFERRRIPGTFRTRNTFVAPSYGKVDLACQAIRNDWIAQGCPAATEIPVGWVERSGTHQLSHKES